jgi:hypothetical protein
MQIATGKVLDCLASNCGITRKTIPGPWYRRVWRWIWGMPMPLETDASLRARCLQCFQLPNQRNRNDF